MKRSPRPYIPPAIALLGLFGACTHEDRVSGTDAAATASAEPSGPDFSSLARQARLESVDPVDECARLPVPPGLEPRLVEPIDRSDPASPALLSLDTVLERLGSELVTPEATPPPPPDAPSKAAALRLYASGRSKLLAGNAGGAILDLESASRLDPTSGAIARELGEAQLQQGKRSAAVSSFRLAVRRGLREPRTLWHLGRQALRDGRHAEAARFLGAARSNEPASADPALPYLIDADLAEAMTALGHHAAAADALDAALAFPAQFSSMSRFRLEFGDLLRRRGDLLRDLGDLSCRLGRFEQAARVYEAASLAPSLDQGATLPRVVHVSLRRGRPSEAALALLESTRRSGDVPDARTIALTRFLAERTDVGPALAEGFAALRTARGPRIGATSAGALARAEAAAAGKDKGKQVLQAHLARHPDDRATLVEFASLSAGNAATLADDLCGLVRRSPQAANECADAALTRRGSADEIIGPLASRGDDAATALRAMLLAKTGRAREGSDLVVGRAWGRDFERAGPAIEAVLAASAGRYADARRAYDALKAGPVSDPRPPVRAALALQLGGEAIALLDRDLAAPGPADADRIDLLLSAAGLCGAMGRSRDAEAYLRRAVQADPSDERPYAGLFRLYSPNGLLADQAKLAEVIRDLREAAPSARVLRFAAAPELVDRRLDAQAEQLLLGVLEESIADSDAGLLLASIWDRRASGAGGSKGALQTAQDWLRARVGAYPEVNWLWVALARVVVAGGDAQGAESMLAERLASRPVEELAVMRESILREALGRREEADALALARVSPEPRTYSATAAYADLLVRTDKREAALAVLRDSLPRDITLTDDQQATLGIMLARVASKYLERPVLCDPASAGLLEEVASRGVRLPPQIHAFRIAVLASRVEDDPGLVMRAADLGGRQDPSLRFEMYRAAAAVYLQLDKVSRAIPFLRKYADNNPGRNPEVVFQLVRAVVMEGSADDVTWLTDAVAARSEIEPILRRMYREPALRIPADDTKLRAEFAYRLGGQMSFRSRAEPAHAAYRAALRFDPDHAWTMNDWGYQLLEEGGDFAEAVRLIEGAYERLPQEANIIDSLGWVRYNQGVFKDDPGPPAREGAVTLFRKATVTELGAANSTIFDHLGDACWAAGEKNDARAAWKRAEELLAADLLEARRTPNAAPEAVARVSASLDAVRAKLRAIDAGQTPAVAKRRGE